MSIIQAQQRWQARPEHARPHVSHAFGICDIWSQSLLVLLKALCTRIAAARQRNAASRQFSGMTDRELADIGITSRSLRAADHFQLPGNWPIG